MGIWKSTFLNKNKLFSLNLSLVLFINQLCSSVSYSCFGKSYSYWSSYLSQKGKSYLNLLYYSRSWMNYSRFLSAIQIYPLWYLLAFTVLFSYSLISKLKMWSDHFNWSLQSHSVSSTLIFQRYKVIFLNVKLILLLLCTESFLRIIFFNIKQTFSILHGKKKFCGSRIIKVFLQACPLALCSRYYCEGSRLPIMCVLNHFSHVWLFVTLWTVAPQAPPSMGFSRQEYWNGLPCPPPGDLPDPGIEHASLTSPALAGRLFTTSDTWEALSSHFKIGGPRGMVWGGWREGGSGWRAYVYLWRIRFDVWQN